LTKVAATVNTSRNKDLGSSMQMNSIGSSQSNHLSPKTFQTCSNVNNRQTKSETSFNQQDVQLVFYMEYSRHKHELFARGPV
jgi:hypothetical protein